jgi:integrase
LKTTREVRRFLTAGKPSPALRPAILLYLHGVRASASIELKVRDVNLGSNPTLVMVNGPRPVYVTDELSRILKGHGGGKPGEDLLLAYACFIEFHADFRRMVRASRTRFDLSDIKEPFRAAAGGDYALLKGNRSEEPRAPEEIRAAWLNVLSRLVVGA